MQHDIITVQHQLTVAGFTLSKTGLAMPDDATFDQWQQVGEWLRYCDGSVHWWIGDWLNQGEQKWGEQYAQAIDATGFDYQTLADDKWVSQSVEFSSREENLTHSHHKAVAKLTPSEQRRFLGEAVKESLTRDDLRRRVSEYKTQLVESERSSVAAAEPDVLSLSGERFRIDQSDCLPWLASLPESSVDLVFGSPPYEDARLYLEGGEDSGIARTTEEWVAWMLEVYEASLKCCKGLVAFVVAGRTEQYRWSASPTLLMADLHRKGVILRNPPLYQRVGIPGSGGPDWLRNDYEFIICTTRGGRLPWSDNVALGEPPKHQPGGDPSHRKQNGSRVNRPGNDGYATPDDRDNSGPHRARVKAGAVYQPPEKANPGNVIRCVVGGGNMGDKLCHENEAPFPESLAEFFVRSFCPPGGVVADPFSGSGTTGKMALTHGRRFIGCDIRPSQVRLTEQRLASVQQTLFDKE